MTPPDAGTAKATEDLSLIRSEADLRARFDVPKSHVTARQLDRLDRHCRRFIELSPFILIASSHRERGLDVSPRGDGPGFVQVIDDRRIVIPERPGNNRLDTLANILDTPAIGTLFLIPGVRETLRLNGDAVVSDETELREACAAGGRLPKVVIVVEVRELFLHCGKALIRSRLWNPEWHVDRTALPSLARMTADQIGEPDRLSALEDAVAKNYKRNLY